MNTSFSIENFRCFEGMTVEPLARVNIIAGKNNTGKSALLEALWMHSGPNIPDLGLRLAAFRGVQAPDPRRLLLHDLFYNFEADRTIVLSCSGDWEGVERRLEIKSEPLDSADVAIPVPHAPWAIPRGAQEADLSAVSDSEIIFDYTDEHGCNYVSSARWARNFNQLPPPVESLPAISFETAGLMSSQAKMPPRPSSILLSSRSRSNHQEDLVRFGEAELDGFSDRIVECLRVVEPRIKRLATIAASPMPMLYADVGLSRLVPLGFMGDGVGRLLSMALAFHNARNGTLLIDEIENGLHHTVMCDVWKNLHWLSKRFNVQVFATTHSYECMVAARDAFAAAEDDALLIHRLGRWKDEPIKAVTYSYEGLDFTLSYGAEVR